MVNPFASEKELLILRMLKDHPDGLYGLELFKTADGELKRGTIYVTLGRMEDKGFISSRIDKKASHSGLPRPRYKIAAPGERVLQAALVMGLLPAGA